jgi:glycosyltransferase involved in cell wall biosynthesis
VRFLGPLRRPDFLKELRSSSVFVLPTLAEGSASVIFEALCSGVPVVTTRSAGSVVTDGKEGRIVPERDPEALAEAVREIVSDRELRASMSAQALRTAADYTEDRWQERLVQALQPPRRY